MTQPAPEPEFRDVVRALGDQLHHLADRWYDLAGPERRVAARLLAEVADDLAPVLARVREGAGRG